MEQPGLEPGTMWNAGSAGRRLTCYTTVQLPNNILKLKYSVNSVVGFSTMQSVLISLI